VSNIYYIARQVGKLEHAGRFAEEQYAVKRAEFNNGINHKPYEVIKVTETVVRLIGGENAKARD
jgi:hypothetical protein